MFIFQWILTMLYLIKCYKRDPIFFQLMGGVKCFILVIYASLLLLFLNIIFFKYTLEEEEFDEYIKDLKYFLYIYIWPCFSVFTQLSFCTIIVLILLEILKLFK